jgi:hypothetical protein
MSTADPYQDLDPRLARALSELRRELDDRLAALRTELGLAGSPAATTRPTAPDYTALLEVVERLEEAEDQSELLGRMLEGAGRFSGRALFLLVRDDRVEGWGGLGFPGESAAEVRAEIARLGPLAACVERRACVDLSAAECLALLGSTVTAPGAPEAGVLVPFALRGRVAAVLYADHAPGQDLTTSALQLLAYSAANSLETLPLRKSTPSVSTVEAVQSAAPQPEEVDTIAVDREEPDDRGAAESAARSLLEEPAERAAEPAEETELAAGAHADEAPRTDAAAPTPEIEPRAEAPGPFDTLAIGRSTVEVAEPPGVEELPEVFPPVPAPGIEGLGGRADGDGSIEVAPPPDLEGPGWAFRERKSSADEGRREEARRLARLLVTEIKLYNEEQVEEGLEQGNLYATLQEEIDRSRRIFEERIPAEVRAETDYFRDELVRILADGDSSALGQ